MSENISVDLSNYKDKSGSHITPGRYTVVVEDAEPDQSRAGNTMIVVYYRVLGGEHDGATLVDRLTLTEKAMFRVVSFMQGIGLPTPRKKVSLNLRQIIGKKLMVDVEDGEPYNGRVKSEVRGHLRIDPKATKGTVTDPVAEGSGLDEFAAASVEGVEAQGDLDLEKVDLG